MDRIYNAALLADYRKFVGWEPYDETGDIIMGILIREGLREDMSVLDVGAGSLRVGRWLIPFLLPGKYTALEPERSILEEGIKHNTIPSIIDYKKPTFLYNNMFRVDGEFDFGLAWNVFIHCGREQFLQFLERCHAATWIVTAITGGKLEQDKVDYDTEDGPTRNYSYRHATHAGYGYEEHDFVSICARFGYATKRLRSIGNNGYVWRLDKTKICKSIVSNI